MNFRKQSVESGEAELEQVLRNFRQSVHAWSEAEYGRSRNTSPAAAHISWKRTLAWALGCILAVASLSVGVYENYHPNQVAKAPTPQMPQHRTSAKAVPAEQPAEKTPEAEATEKQVARAESSNPDAGLLAAVDSDVSRQVPSAMEPLAQLMEGSLSQ